MGLLRYVKAIEVSRLIEELHVGTCVSHMNGFMLAKKILRSGYFWLTMETYCICYIYKCHQCQTHTDMIRVPPRDLHVTSLPWPFIAWGMEIIGPIEPTVSNDYFTKWVKATSHKSVTKKVVDDLFEITSYFGSKFPSLLSQIMVPNKTLI